MKVYQELESLFKMRISSNDDIVSYMVRMSKLGKIDEPKKVAMFTIILDRLGRLEDEQEQFETSIESRIQAIGRRVDDEPAGTLTKEDIGQKYQDVLEMESNESKEIVEKEAETLPQANTEETAVTTPTESLSKDAPKEASHKKKHSSAK